MFDREDELAVPMFWWTEEFLDKKAQHELFLHKKAWHFQHRWNYSLWN